MNKAVEAGLVETLSQIILNRLNLFENLSSRDISIEGVQILKSLLRILIPIANSGSGTSSLLSDTRVLPSLLKLIPSML